MAQTTTDKKVDLYQKVTDRIIVLLEKGTVPWKRTWSSYGMAKNYATGHQYTGINAILMNCTPHEIPYFLTFKQAKQLGGKVKKGAKAEQVIYFSIYYKDENNKTITREKARALKAKGQDIAVLKFIKYFNVFPIEQVEGIAYDLPEVQLSDNEKIERCEQVIQHMPNAPKIDVLSSSRAFYSPHKDRVQMPAINQFESSEEYYCTLFHEIVHSTGHQKRLNRPSLSQYAPFGSKLYSEEELLAEMGASFLCAHCGIDYEAVTENSAAYIAGWLQKLRADKKFLFKSAAEAQKAVDYIKGKD